MSTTATVRFYGCEVHPRHTTEIACHPRVAAHLYKTTEGGPRRFGLELVTFLASRRVVAGVPAKPPRKPWFEYANGAGDLAAQVVAKFKHGTGDLYVLDEETAGRGDWLYEVYACPSEPLGVTLTIWGDAADYPFTGTNKDALTHREIMVANRGDVPKALRDPELTRGGNT